jgi:PIN domain nuclease of toxin-antitoxin system
MIYLDTHAIVALYQGEPTFLSPSALDALEQESDLRISPMALLELEYLFEIKRLRVPAARIVSSLTTEIGLKVCDMPFSEVVQNALEERWTRDPFDRLIVGQARANSAVLITRDRLMQRRYSRAMG